MKFFSKKIVNSKKVIEFDHDMEKYVVQGNVRVPSLISFSTEDSDACSSSDNESLNGDDSKYFDEASSFIETSAPVESIDDEPTADEMWDTVTKVKTEKLLEESITRLTRMLDALKTKMYHSSRILQMHVESNKNIPTVVQAMKQLLALECQREKTINAITLLGMLLLEVKKCTTRNTQKVNFQKRFQMILSEPAPSPEFTSFSELHEEAVARVNALSLVASIGAGDFMSQQEHRVRNMY